MCWWCYITEHNHIPPRYQSCRRISPTLQLVGVSADQPQHARYKHPTSHRLFYIFEVIFAMQLVAIHPHDSPPIALTLHAIQLGRVRECKVLDGQVSRKQCNVRTLERWVFVQRVAFAPTHQMYLHRPRSLYLCVQIPTERLLRAKHVCIL